MSGDLEPGCYRAADGRQYAYDGHGWYGAGNYDCSLGEAPAGPYTRLGVADQSQPDTRAGFNPGEGWVEWPLDQPLDGRRSLIEHDEHGRVVREWVREEPMPPLPTTPGAVITWRDGAYLPQLAQLDPGPARNGWWAPDDTGNLRWMTPQQLSDRIGSDAWTVLEPRAEVAKAVLDRVDALWLRNSSWGDVLEKAREDFEVEE